jgi:hypothetical protein
MEMMAGFSHPRLEKESRLSKMKEMVSDEELRGLDSDLEWK